MFRCLNVEPWNALQSTSSRCFTLTVFAAAIPAWWEISTVTEPCFIHLHITPPPSNLICHWMASKRQSIVAWCGGTEIHAASNLSIKATLAQRTARSEGATAHSPKLADFTLLPISRMTARLSSWCATAVQIREIFISTVDRLAEFLGSARGLYVPQHRLCIVQPWAFGGTSPTSPCFD